MQKQQAPKNRSEMPALTLPYLASSRVLVGWVGPPKVIHLLKRIPSIAA